MIKGDDLGGDGATLWSAGIETIGNTKLRSSPLLWPPVCLCLIVGDFVVREMQENMLSRVTS